MLLFFVRGGRLGGHGKLALWHIQMSLLYVRMKPCDTYTSIYSMNASSININLLQRQQPRILFIQNHQQNSTSKTKPTFASMESNLSIVSLKLLLPI